MHATLSDLIAEDDELYHKEEITSRFGEAFWDEVIGRMVATSFYSRHECEVMLDDCIAYWMARATLGDPSFQPLVANLGPDFAQHYLLLYTWEAAELMHDLTELAHGPDGIAFIHHDPASESALVNTEEATEKTIAVFIREDISYHPRLWNDHREFPDGATLIRTGIVARVSWPGDLRQYSGIMAG